MAIKIEIKELELENTKLNKLKIYLSLNIFGKFDIIKIKFDKKKITKMINKNNKKIDVKKLKTDDIKYLLQRIKIENVDIRTKIGTKNPAFTAFSVSIISAILAIILAKITINPRYKIEPVYIDRNYLFLSINCIFKIKLVHIISIIKKLKGKECQKYGETSNRGTYANCNG